MSRSSAKSTPALAAGATSLLSAPAVAEVFRRVLQAVLRLAVRAGLRYPELDLILREALLEEARRQLSPEQKTNASKLSVMTGLHRKFVAAQLAKPADDNSLENSNVRPRTAASQVFERWAHDARKRSTARTLSLNKTSRRTTFGELASSVVSDVHPRAILDELVRLGLVEEREGDVHLLADSFTPEGKSDALLALMNDNAGAMLDTSISNILSTGPRQLEQSIWGVGVSVDSAQRIAGVAAEKWRDAHESLFKAISDAPEASAAEPRYRIRIGMYVNYVPHDARIE